MVLVEIAGQLVKMARAEAKARGLRIVRSVRTKICKPTFDASVRTK